MLARLAATAQSRACRLNLVIGVDIVGRRTPKSRLHRGAVERFGRALFERALFERASEDTQGFPSIGFDHPEPARRIDRISGQD